MTVVGTGYVGLVTGTCFAETGNDVVCVDIDETKVAQLKKKHTPIYEPRLNDLLARNVDFGRLAFITSLAEAVATAEIIFLALPTPPDEDGSADLSYILGVAKQLGPLLKKYTVVINKSTVPVGTTEKIREAIGQGTKATFDVVSNPEFLREGLAVDDFMKPDRIVIGTSSSKARAAMEELYQPFSSQGSPILFMDERSAEMTKYAANAFLATKISFMNEVANLCERTGADVDAVRLGIGADKRIGQRFLFAGIGYGGSCFPKDILALQKIAKGHDYDFKILDAVQDVNALQKKTIVQKVKKYYQGDIVNKTFALWGLSFKPDTDDIREAPALLIIDELLASKASVIAFDPEATANVKKLYKGQAKLKFASGPYEALTNADALIIATEWQIFKSPDFPKMKRQLKQPVIFDGRNIYSLEEAREHGFYYQSIGRATVRGDEN
ncbi:MAG TPA: UDP-glucose/GDP-mannose dehydrogenase family protein [Candidatus Saccharimonadales bacterium]|nr:UDP-glucose/GDP-mannose dehydrogenase family protein [Candidatus Saccharimonadales bacterium]